MNVNSLLLTTQDEYIQAACDPQLSSPHTHLLATLLSEEDQHDYNQLLQVQLPKDILQILHQLSSLLHISSSAIWMSIVLLKKLIIQQYFLSSIYSLFHMNVIS
ncbi:unnamed protein product [Rotaria sordida]|uniref:Uncharacterized protein n=1 Tax=Rotaria sordida TaxID=392033 RepID=A0A818LFL0_9BILA|nr:unnamed protein product [Rotaria sordida]